MQCLKYPGFSDNGTKIEAIKRRIETVRERFINSSVVNFY